MRWTSSSFHYRRKGWCDFVLVKLCCRRQQSFSTPVHFFFYTLMVYCSIPSLEMHLVLQYPTVHTVLLLWCTWWDVQPRMQRRDCRPWNGDRCETVVHLRCKSKSYRFTCIFDAKWQMSEMHLRCKDKEEDCAHTSGKFSTWFLLDNFLPQAKYNSTVRVQSPVPYSVWRQTTNGENKKTKDPLLKLLRIYNIVIEYKTPLRYRVIDIAIWTLDVLPQEKQTQKE